ncbi:MAG: hypothetical protein HQM16_14360 [Deltaproteobacteria bacterium]|nr:hypothetical protein [Deltaproteobacteria bacterium]
MLKVVNEAKPFLITSILEPYFGTSIQKKLNANNLLIRKENKPEIKITDGLVKNIYSLSRKLLKTYIPALQSYVSITKPVTLEWHTKPKDPYSENWYHELNSIFFKTFYSAVDFLLDKKSDLTHDSNRCLAAHNKHLLKHYKNEMRSHEAKLLLTKELVKGS